MTVDTFRIGPHTPTMKTEDVHLVHRLWLNITRETGLDAVHHHDILTEALTRFARDYAGHDRESILKELRRISGRHTGHHADSKREPVVVDEHTQIKDDGDITPGSQ